MGIAKRHCWMASQMKTHKVLEPLRKLTRSPRKVTVFQDDVFVVSYPKSGNTWCRFLIGNLLSGGAEISFANIETKIPDIYRHSNGYLLKIPKPRILKSHEYFIPDYRNIIYVIRDPRAVVISYYYYLQEYTAQFAPVDLSSFVKIFLYGKLDSYGTWGQHVSSWHWEIRNNKRVLLLRYEDILEDTERELKKIATFLEVNASGEKLKKVIKASSFSQMRALETLHPDHLAEVRGRNLKNDVAFIREGKAKGWQGVLSDTDEKRIESEWGVLMDDFGYL